MPPEDTSVDMLGVLTSFDDGQLLERWYLGLTRITDDLELLRKGSGTATLELTATWDEKLEAIIVAPSLKVKLPSRRMGARLFFAGGGLLHRRDPRQAVMEFRVVEEPATPARTIDHEPLTAKEVN